jgi:hypothetical protein
MRSQTAQRWFQGRPDLRLARQFGRAPSGLNRAIGNRRDRTGDFGPPEIPAWPLANAGRLGRPSFESRNKRCLRRGRSRLRYSQIAFGLYPPTSRARERNSPFCVSRATCFSCCASKRLSCFMISISFAGSSCCRAFCRSSRHPAGSRSRIVQISSGMKWIS